MFSDSLGGAPHTSESDPLSTVAGTMGALRPAGHRKLAEGMAADAQLALAAITSAVLIAWLLTCAV
jgi:hypothetical protein